MEPFLKISPAFATSLSGAGEVGDLLPVSRCGCGLCPEHAPAKSPASRSGFPADILLLMGLQKYTVVNFYVVSKSRSKYIFICVNAVFNLLGVLHVAVFLV